MGGVLAGGQPTPSPCKNDWPAKNDQPRPRVGQAGSKARPNGRAQKASQRGSKSDPKRDPQVTPKGSPKRTQEGSPKGPPKGARNGTFWEAGDGENALFSLCFHSFRPPGKGSLNDPKATRKGDPKWSPKRPQSEPERLPKGMCSRRIPTSSMFRCTISLRMA